MKWNDRDIPAKDGQQSDAELTHTKLTVFQGRYHLHNGWSVTCPMWSRHTMVSAASLEEAKKKAKALLYKILQETLDEVKR